MSLNQLFRKKSLEILLDEMAGEHRLHRVLGPISLTALGIGSIIGAGIFVMTGRVAAVDAGPAILISYTVAAVGCALAALCYAEFAAMAPVAGSAYTYSYTTLGEVFAWIIGWDLILEYSMACATVAAAWPKYLNELLHALGAPIIDPRFITDPFSTIHGAETHGIVNLPAAIIMGIITWILVLGIRESARTNAVLVVVKLAVVIFVIIVGWSYVNPSNWTEIPVNARIDKPGADPAAKWGILGLLGINEWLTPIDKAVQSPFAPYGFSGIMAGAAMVFFAYIGFDSISTHAEEAINPQRDVPFGILASLVICTLLYIGVAAVITGMVPYPEIHQDAAVAAAFRQKAQTDPSPLLRWSNGLVAAGGLAGMTSVLLVTFLSQVRVFLAIARDGLLPPIFKDVHPKYRTPHLATMLTGGVICLATAFTPIHILEQMVNIGTLMAFVIVCGSVLMLRVQRPDVNRPFRCPAIYIVAPLGILVNFIMMLFQPWETWLRLAVWLAAGLAIYWFYGRHHSTLGQAIAREIHTQGFGPTDAPLPGPKR
jgi:APA family basic amino acid/polyamine antiporter